MPADTKYLERHGNQWRVQVKVPVKARAILGKSRLVRGLGTDSLSKAKLLRWEVVAEFQRTIAAAIKALDNAMGSAASTIALEADDYLSALRKAERNPLEYLDHDASGELVADGPKLVLSLIEERTSELMETAGAE